MTRDHRYLPAAGHDFFLPLYDPIARLFGFSKALEPLLAQAELHPDHRVLDVGCGTGTLAVAIKQRNPGVTVTGLDPDPRALTRARRKAERAGMSVRFEQGFGNALPFGDGAFDRVFSSLMFHHLQKDDRPKVLAEIHRVLAPGGRLEFLDFAGGSHGFLTQMLHGHHPLPEEGDRLAGLMREAGFARAQRVGDRDTLFGKIAFYQATV